MAVLHILVEHVAVVFISWTHCLGQSHNIILGKRLHRLKFERHKVRIFNTQHTLRKHELLKGKKLTFQSLQLGVTSAITPDLPVIILRKPKSNQVILAEQSRRSSSL
ncbi:hypothetical protein AOQ84DRAFT_22705 [Glonium stellatum]|uniref:Secreted protein n=1 Tax=Glonium stellatum TaxID=574774 RepID=A0A8E2JTU1_9PEZI|nr:hypothetical protein AOQ84DRAFT_22705 [Glonium stellatum]